MFSKLPRTIPNDLVGRIWPPALEFNTRASSTDSRTDTISTLVFIKIKIHFTLVKLDLPVTFSRNHGDVIREQSPGWVHGGVGNVVTLRKYQIKPHSGLTLVLMSLCCERRQWQLLVCRPLVPGDSVFVLNFFYLCVCLCVWFWVTVTTMTRLQGFIWLLFLLMRLQMSWDVRACVSKCCLLDCISDCILKLTFDLTYLKLHQFA